MSWNYLSSKNIEDIRFIDALLSVLLKIRGILLSLSTLLIEVHAKSIQTEIT